MTVEDDTIYQVEIEVKPKDLQYLRNHPNRSAIWLSKKLIEKGKEKEWSKMTLEEKKNFDLAQAKEMSQVLQSKALRSLTIQEQKQLNPKSVMTMRWVLTVKGDQSAKARLVVCGYQAPNLVSVQSSSPIMSRLSRNMILALSANLGFRIRGGDVTSAFLQADQSLEDQGLTVWAPSELAVLFGAPPERPCMPLRITRAFYGLVNAPKAWYDHLSNTLVKIGYRQMQADKCVFALYDTSQAGSPVVSVAGVHVDDVLVGGAEESKVFQSALEALQGAYKWGKWDVDSFTFTGCQISSSTDGTIKISQKEFTERWIEEIELTPARAKQTKDKATAAEVSALRGCIGTVAWRASQTSPQFLADAGLLLSEVPVATVDTLVRANKLVREMRRESDQCLTFFHWNRPWRELTIGLTAVQQWALFWGWPLLSFFQEKNTTLHCCSGNPPRLHAKCWVQTARKCSP